MSASVTNNDNNKTDAQDTSSQQGQINKLLQQNAEQNVETNKESEITNNRKDEKKISEACNKKKRSPCPWQLHPPPRPFKKARYAWQIKNYEHTVSRMRKAIAQQQQQQQQQLAGHCSSNYRGGTTARDDENNTARACPTAAHYPGMYNNLPAGYPANLYNPLLRWSKLAASSVDSPVNRMLHSIFSGNEPPSDLHPLLMLSLAEGNAAALNENLNCEDLPGSIPVEALSAALMPSQLQSTLHNSNLSSPPTSDYDSSSDDTSLGEELISDPPQVLRHMPSSPYQHHQQQNITGYPLQQCQINCHGACPNYHQDNLQPSLPNAARKLMQQHHNSDDPDPASFMFQNAMMNCPISMANRHLLNFQLQNFCERMQANTNLLPFAPYQHFTQTAARISDYIESQDENKVANAVDSSFRRNTPMETFEVTPHETLDVPIRLPAEEIIAAANAVAAVRANAEGTIGLGNNQGASATDDQSRTSDSAACVVHKKVQKIVSGKNLEDSQSTHILGEVKKLDNLEENDKPNNKEHQLETIVYQKNVTDIIGKVVDDLKAPISDSDHLTSHNKMGTIDEDKVVVGNIKEASVCVVASAVTEKSSGVSSSKDSSTAENVDENSTMSSAVNADTEDGKNFSSSLEHKSTSKLREHVTSQTLENATSKHKHNITSKPDRVNQSNSPTLTESSKTSGNTSSPRLNCQTVDINKAISTGSPAINYSSDYYSDDAVSASVLKRKLEHIDSGESCSPDRLSSNISSYKCLNCVNGCDNCTKDLRDTKIDESSLNNNNSLTVVTCSCVIAKQAESQIVTHRDEQRQRRSSECGGGWHMQVQGGTNARQHWPAVEKKQNNRRDSNVHTWQETDDNELGSKMSWREGPVNKKQCRECCMQSRSRSAEADAGDVTTVISGQEDDDSAFRSKSATPPSTADDPAMDSPTFKDDTSSSTAAAATAVVHHIHDNNNDKYFIDQAFHLAIKQGLGYQKA